MNKIVYEDDNWIIEILSETEYNPIIRISSFKDCHFVNDIELSRLAMEDDVMDEVKELLYR